MNDHGCQRRHISVLIGMACVLSLQAWVASPASLAAEDTPENRQAPDAPGTTGTPNYP